MRRKFSIFVITVIMLVIGTFVLGLAAYNSGSRDSGEQESLSQPVGTRLQRQPPPAVIEQNEFAATTPPGTPSPGTPEPLEIAQARDEQEVFLETHGVNPLVDTDIDHLSTFSMDVDTASYTVARSHLMNYAQLPPADAIRSEEFINYFDVGYPGPQDDKSKIAYHLSKKHWPCW
jgi:Ca-activated chloride channel family protein